MGSSNAAPKNLRKRRPYQGKRPQFAKHLNIDDSLKFSNGWIQLFCQRYGFKAHRSHGESGDAQMDNIDNVITTFKATIAEYSPRDVYNMDETGLFYNLAPDITITRRQIEGSKKDKTRIMIPFTCSADGTDQFTPIFIGHTNMPRCFKKKTGHEHGIFYTSNKRASMTGLLFLSFLNRFLLWDMYM